MIQNDLKIFVAGHNGMVGSAVVRALRKRNHKSLILTDRRETDLRDSAAVRNFLQKNRPDLVILAAARVGGIKANSTFPADFIFDNLMIQTNVIHESYKAGVKKLVFLGSSCVYPRNCPQPIKEEYLLTGPLEPTNEAYAIAKIAGLKMAQFYFQQNAFPCISLMPCNLYGTNDCFDLEKSHVLSALVRRFVDAVEEGLPEVTLWGTGKPLREFMHVDDCAEAILFLLEKYDSPSLINVGTGLEITIKALAELIASEAGFKGKISWDTSMPDGMPRKCMDVSKIRELGFSPKISLKEGVRRTIQEYREIKKSKGVSKG